MYFQHSSLTFKPHLSLVTHILKYISRVTVPPQGNVQPIDYQNAYTAANGMVEKAGQKYSASQSKMLERTDKFYSVLEICY